jgi:hypothetical protein
VYIHSIKPEVVGKLKKKRRACVRWSRGGPVEAFVWLYRERETWSGFYSKLFFFS